MASDTQRRPSAMMRQKSLERWAHVRRYTDESESSFEIENSPLSTSSRKIVSHSNQLRRWVPPLSRPPNPQSSEAPPNVLEWLQSSCPADLIPKVLAFAGPQMMSRLNQTNRFFHETIQKDETWRVVCEELYKWKPGDKEPSSWFEFYQRSPCVPTDYSTIPKALQVACAKPGKRRQNQKQVRPIRILVRPGVYSIHESMKIQSQKHFSITVEVISLPDTVFRSSAQHHQEVISRPEIRRSGLRRFFSCTRMDLTDVIGSTETFLDDRDYLVQRSAIASSRATLVFRTRRSNEPLFRVQQGHLILKGLDITHFCEGTDIWNGNAAVQIQPPGDEFTPRYARPSVMLEQVSVTSQSGRGIVNIDGGTVVMKQCAIQDCAATGLYVGGPGSHAVVEDSDIYRNGVGNIIGGVARGHSGFYLEQGTAHVKNCKISDNTLTGISAVSPSNAILTLESSDLVANGSNQLELPPLGSVARQKTVVTNNQLKSNGVACFRSGLITQT
ncbi:hypothetical protein FisN_15Hh135 [Fistulifera solaris]|uniref:Right handed beta helix domain-containing protein n=1 Tax=Fistulifera solaris TaxID=1519565 RepID=A0A1Z5K9L4_FISSO|nr:hypothetical protein FisN_15Hh135 [Fistulifera solaris]|eukprot:GAX22970.1 hypothetical protein FisN_15Hh135 [Fistulifera solaris]